MLACGPGLWGAARDGRAERDLRLAVHAAVPVPWLVRHDRTAGALVNPTVIATCFAVIFMAELPDKTALASLMLGSRYPAGFAVLFAGGAALMLRRTDEDPPPVAGGDGLLDGQDREADRSPAAADQGSGRVARLARPGSAARVLAGRGAQFRGAIRRGVRGPDPAAHRQPRRPLLRSGLRRLALGGIAVAVTFAVGSLIGAHVH